jgi:hypothetical protein
MRDDQLDRLKELAESVAEVFIQEADPQTWSGAGILMADMDVQTRGDRYWCKKNAIQTGSLLARVLDLAERETRPTWKEHADDDDAEKDIADFEKKAKKLLDAVNQRSLQ